jgi:hypothetical protein
MTRRNKILSMLGIAALAGLAAWALRPQPIAVEAAAAASGAFEQTVSDDGKTGKVGRGQDFSTGDDLSVLADGPLHYTDTMTIEAWVQPLEDTWGWFRYVSISPATPAADFQVEVTLDASFDYDQANADGSDLRFFAQDGTTALDYWIERWQVGGTSTIWVKVLTSGTTVIYMAYGNSAATAQKPPYVV